MLPSCACICTNTIMKTAGKINLNNFIYFQFLPAVKLQKKMAEQVKKATKFFTNVSIQFQHSAKKKPCTKPDNLAIGTR